MSLAYDLYSVRLSAIDQLPRTKLSVINNLNRHTLIFPSLNVLTICKAKFITQYAYNYYCPKIFVNFYQC